jgi:ribosomal protein L40E
MIKKLKDVFIVARSTQIIIKYRMKICNNISCNCSNPDDANYCRKCGYNFQNVSVGDIIKDNNLTSTIIDSKKIDVKTDSDDTWRVIATIILIIVAIAIVVGTGGIGTPVAFGIAYGIRSIWKKS